MIDLDKKIIFTHHPRCGGTTIEAAFGWFKNTEMFDKLGQHASLEEHIKMLRDQNINYKDFFKFTCIRNPWDVLVSRYYHDKSSKDIPVTIKSLDFDQYVKFRLESQNPKKTKVVNFTPFLFYNNEFCMDYVIRFENYKEDVNKALKQLNVKWPEKNYNVSKEKKGHYRTFYKNPKTRKLVEEAGKDVIELFGYKF